MKNNVWKAWLVALSVVLGLFRPVHGAQYFSAAGGAQPWDTTTANWGATTGGPYDSVWTDGDAVFEGTAGTVNVSTVSASSLTFSVAGYLLTNGTLTLAGPVAVGGSTTIASALAGTAGLTKTGSGTLTLGATTNLYSGGTLVSGGTLAAGSDAQLGAAGESLTLAGGTFRNTGSFTTATRPLTLGAGGGTISLGNYLNYNGPITGGAGLFVSGSDFILAPPSANSLGTVTMSGSRLFINNANALANNAACIITNGAKLVFQSSAPTAPQNPMTFYSGCGFSARINNIVLSTTNAALPSSGTFSFNNDDAITYAMQVVGDWPALTGALTLQVGGGNTNAGAVGAVTLSAPLTGAYGVTKSGTSTSPGTLILAAANTFSGGLTVSSGTVKLGNAGGLGATNVTVNPGATLDLAGYSPQIRGLYDSQSLGSVNSGVVTNSGALATLSVVRANFGFGGTIAGAISLLIPGGGGSYQVLSGNNTYTGLTTVASGSSLEVWNTNALGAVSAGTVLTNASLSMKGLQGNMAFAAEPLAVGGSCSLYLNTDSTLTNAVWAGPIALASNAVFSITRAGGTGKPSLIDLQGAITGAGAIAKSDTNTAAMLSGANDYSGGTTLTSGLLKLGSATGLGTGPVTLTLGTLDLNGVGATIGSLSGTTNSVIVDFSAGAGTNTLTINQAVAGNMLGTISNGLNKTLAFVKAGAGTLTLSNTNTFTGTATISGGALKLNTTSALPASAIAVTSGGTLDINSQALSTSSRTLSIAGPGAAGQSGALVNTGPGNEARVDNLTLAGDATIGSTGNKMNVYGTLNGGGNVLTVAGTGEINIRPNNAFQNLAGVTVNSGLFRLESSQSWTGTYTVNAGGKLDTYGTPRTEAGGVSLNGGRLANGGTGQMHAIWTGAFSLTGTCVVDTVGGNITVSNAVSGSGSLTKVSTNALVLCSACSFGGALCVSNGTLTLNGSLAHANITVVSNAVFGGSGTVHCRVAKETNDTAVVKGTMNLSGLSLDLDVAGMLSGGGPYTLVDATGGTLTGKFAAVLDAPGGYSVVYGDSKVMLRPSGTLFRVH